MKKVNFITTLSPQKQYAIRRWFVVTIFLSMCSLLVSLYLILPPLLTYIALQKEVRELRVVTQEYGARIKEKDELTKEHDQVRIRIKKIETYNDAPKNPHQYIAAIVQASGDGVTLEALKFNKKECDITLLCPTSEHATVFIKRLSASDLFMNGKLVSLQQEPVAKQLRCIVKSRVR